MGRVDNPVNDPRVPAGEPAAQPLVLIPVTAEDVSRRKRRMVLLSLMVLVVLAVIGGFIYNRSLNPLHAQESYDSGVRFYKVGRYPQAILSFDRSITLKPDLTDAYLMRARAYVSNGQPDRAIGDFSNVITSRPRDTQALTERAAVYLELKDFQPAIADADKALATDSKLADAYNVRGGALQGTGNPAKALEDFTRAIELAPTQDYYLQRGAVYQTLGEHRRAIADFDQAIGFFPRAPEGYYARAKSRVAVGDLKGAKADQEFANNLGLK